MSLPHRFLKTTRTVHLYLGVFAAPMLLFLALTGGLQTFSLHETTRGSSYTPPAWLASAAQFHKKQTPVMPVPRPRPPADAAAQVPVSTTTDAKPASPAARSNSSDARPKKNLLPMKAFFALVALSLFISVLSGLYMAWRYSRKPALFGTVLGAGIFVPLLLLLF